MIFDPKEPQFGLINSYKHNQLNCFMNAVLQTIWNIGPLNKSVEKFTELKLNEKDMSDEARLLNEIQKLFL